ncbi:unnamed protein product [Arctia plantaginis]|uniref:Uncharacterized protein n=1 Tax=Arctia plantaginis TaxID=874455 RepID=A0A8S0Z2J4_ARCPL|nr:unnamed protein product [Arctia plantaginis]
MHDKLITISTDERLTLKQKFNHGYQKFWLQHNIETQYSALLNIADKSIFAFLSSYLVEKWFSSVANILKKQRVRFKITEAKNLRLQFTNIEPDLSTR